MMGAGSARQLLVSGGEGAHFQYVESSQDSDGPFELDLEQSQ